MNTVFRSTRLACGVAFCGLLVAGSSALAADLYGRGGGLKDGPFYEAPALWQGFYLGGHVGAAWSKADVDDVFDYNGDPQFKGNLNTNGFTGGGQLGYNFQRGNLVFGVEGDIGYLKVDASKDVAFRPTTCVGTYTSAPYTVNYDPKMCAVDTKYSASGDLYGDITGRLGYAFDRTLFYAKGGVAFLNGDFKAKYSGANCKTLNQCGSGGPAVFDYDHSETLVGWTIGAGVEYKLTSSWSLKAEYQHFDFGSISYRYKDSYAIPGYDHTGGHYTSTLDGKTKVDFTADAVTVGLNYHVGGGEYVGLK
ncbi:porin family protein [Rhodomicrobium vannielii ATCC 17100]|uniref:outer membrane protein n=1 Tax=Rhodomicrobium vannielii TaxID=1069 RepID=UPI00191B645E|nr:outer membrane beta-barrel protein [Rhodomicrobium vannielii]MBJ7534766.1 porin family protein [Rhodomicrobium vannielii ATCC 17100]